MSTIIKLNPSYVKGYIPRTTVGSYLVLPKMAMIRLTDYLKWSEDDSIKTDWNYLVSDIEPLLKGDEIMMYMTLSDTEDLQHLANKLNISVQSIKKWNKMRLNYAYPGQKILVVLNKDIAIPDGKRAQLVYFIGVVEVSYGTSTSFFKGLTNSSPSLLELYSYLLKNPNNNYLYKRGTYLMLAEIAIAIQS